MSMTTISKLKASTPNKFLGDPSDTQRWLYSIKAFFLLNNKVYDSDAKKHYYNNIFSPSTPSFGTFEDFKKKFKTSSITDYIAKFKTISAQSTMKKSVSLIYFKEIGLNPGLCDAIYSKETVPETIEKWYTAATLLDMNWQHAKVMRRTINKPHLPAGHRFIPKPGPIQRDPNAMDVDRTLTQKQKTCYMKEG
ncbi:hypothetical protein BDR05DRAFT_1002886 [Suillus weaverae]|nr:hypothetical protein BDR05DRAFT_1002886 [Suillus weaverae]